MKKFGKFLRRLLKIYVENVFDKLKKVLLQESKDERLDKKNRQSEWCQVDSTQYVISTYTLNIVSELILGDKDWVGYSLNRSLNFRTSLKFIERVNLFSDFPLF